MALYLSPGTITAIDDNRKAQNIQRLLIEKWITIYDYGTLTRGYILAGYKGTACCNDVNRAQYATESTIHLYSGVTNSNYSGGSTSFAYNKGIAWGWGSGCCQGSCNETRLWDLATETESTGPTMYCARTYPAVWSRHAYRSQQGGSSSERFNTIDTIEAGYCTGGQGGCDNTNKYPFNTGTMTTSATAPSGHKLGQTAWHQGEYSYTMGYDGGHGSPYAFHNTNETWSSATASPNYSTITNLAVMCNTHGFEQAYGGTHNLSPGFFKSRGLQTTITNTAVSSWGGFRGTSTSYQSEWSPVYSSHASYFLGGHMGPAGQNTHAGKFDCMTDAAHNVAAMETYSDISGTCSAAGFQR